MEAYKAPGRIGKVNITAYLNPEYKSGLRIIQAKTGQTMQEIIREALNDVFIKHKVPLEGKHNG